LKSGGGVCETKGHHLVLVVPVSCAESSLVDVILVDVDLVVSPPKINLSEDFCTKQSVNEVVDERNGKVVLDGDVVESMVVDTHT
jgi:hypothetical protein